MAISTLTVQHKQESALKVPTKEMYIKLMKYS